MKKVIGERIEVEKELRKSKVQLTDCLENFLSCIGNKERERERERERE